LRLVGGFGGWDIERRQTNSTTTDPRCHGNEIWHKIDYDSACIRDIAEILAPSMGFGVWLLNGDKTFYHD